MGRPNTLRERWLAVLDATPYEVLPCCPKITLMVLSRDMRNDGYVSPNRAELAARLNCGERTIDKHLRAAVDADLLAHVSRAHKGRLAVYRAMIPDSMRALQRAHDGRAIDGAKGVIDRRADGRFSAPVTGAPTTETSVLSLSRQPTMSAAATPELAQFAATSRHEPIDVTADVDRRLLSTSMRTADRVAEIRNEHGDSRSTAHESPEKPHVADGSRCTDCGARLSRHHWQAGQTVCSACWRDERRTA